MNAKVFRYRFVFISVTILSLVVIQPILYLRMLNSHPDRTGADFISFYTAGVIAQQYGPQNVYNLDLQRQVEESIVGFELASNQVLIYIHMPYLIPVFSWITSENYIFSFARWSFLSLALYIISLGLLIQTLDKNSDLHRQRILLLLSFITFFPLFVSIVNGQDTAILFLGMALWYRGFTNQNNLLAGLGLALVTSRPHIAIMLSLPFLFRQRKIWWWFVAFAAILGAFSFFLIGIDGTREYLNLLSLTASGDGFGVNQDKMVNLLGLMARIAPGISPAILKTVPWGFYLLTIIGLCILWGKSRELTSVHLATAILAAILTVPHLHYHDLTLLIIPIFIVMQSHKQTLPQIFTLPEFPLIISLLLLLSGLDVGIKLLIPYVIFVLLYLILWHPKLFRHTIQLTGYF